MAAEIRRAIDILLKLRLAAYGKTLDAIKAEIGGGGERLDSRLAMLNSFVEAFRSYVRRVLRDYIDALTLFDGFDVADEAWAVFSAHIDAAREQIARRFELANRADHKRLLNQTLSVKADAHSVYRLAAEQAARVGRRNDASATELDDRLPVGRRAAFDRDSMQAVQESEREAQPCALVMMDIDHFKNVNDQHGHQIGDDVLLGVARRIIARIGGKGRAYRYGGEEFAAVLPGYSAEEAWGLAERIRKDIEQEPMSGKKLNITASFGVASAPGHGKGAKQLVKRADTALYEAKRGGRNQVRIAAGGG